MKKILFCCFCICFFFVSCNRNKTTGVVVTPEGSDGKEKFDPFVEGNKKIVSLENEEIDLFLKRYGWKMETTGTGLRMEKVKTTTGIAPKEGNIVSLKYKTYLLNGDLIYDSDLQGEKIFKLKQSEEIVGLHEAVSMMREGEIARLIIPAHLAYGIAGDGDKISGHNSIAMYIELTKVK